MPLWVTLTFDAIRSAGTGAGADCGRWAGIPVVPSQGMPFSTFVFPAEAGIDLITPWNLKRVCSCPHGKVWKVIPDDRHGHLSYPTGRQWVLDVI
jgi:hypothetical protein